MPNGTLTSATQPSTKAICNAVYDIALNKSGLQFAGSKQWDMPLATQLTGMPFLVVMRPEFAGYANSQGQPVGKELKRGIGAIKKAYDIEVYVIYPFDPNLMSTYPDAQDAIDTLENAFIRYQNLEGTCYNANVMEPQSGPLHIGNQYGQLEPSRKLWSVFLTIRAYVEILTVN